jgi:putative Holliday junction resolvase
MNILALDYGTKRIGMAISDSMGMFASSLPFLENKTDKESAQIIADKVSKEEIELLLIGMPRNMDGSYGESAEKVKNFIILLNSVTSVKIKTVDERLSTVEASKRLRESGIKAKDQRSKIDSMSAQILLQSYLDFQ